MLLGLIEGVHHQCHDGLVDTETTHQVGVLEEDLVVGKVPEHTEGTKP